jgi:hypothetical protein
MLWTMIVSALPLLLGCPYIFGGPDMSNVPGPRPGPTTVPTDTGAPTSVDTSTGLTETGSPGSTDTAPTTGSADTGLGTPGTAPELVDAEMFYRWHGLGVSVVLADVDGDLEGGTLVITDQGTEHPFLIPDDLAFFDAKTGEARASFRPLDYCDGIDRQLTVRITDAKGNTSIPVALQAEVFGVGKLVETGEYTTVLGDIEVPAVFCAEATDDYDSDAFDFIVPSPAEYTFTLGWDGKADLDFSVYEGYQHIGGTITFSDIPPETTSMLLQSGPEYQFQTFWYHGETVDWTLLIE